MGLQHRALVAVHDGGRESRSSGSLGRIGGCDRGQLGGFSHESEDDLGILIRDFIERMVVVEMSLGIAAIEIQVPLISFSSPIRFW
ncbi:hypothetical protein Acr_00g0016190 [Actinidia rufa]|uniref:Uncharacterized protein n=1 Tax=Actinidia rufa TaxID=165716 RepID=A0A7J0DAU0_9ERIC|nr:hypothetical protein Acr_00g0016190 [Actinidia rufa]